MKKQLLIVGSLLFMGLGSIAQHVETKASFLSLEDVPQIPIFQRIAMPMPNKANDGFNEVPKNPLNTVIEGGGNTLNCVSL